MPKILIMLATYNGEKYIKEQMDSILSQTYKDFDLLISDDSSKDRTREILNFYKETYTNIEVIQNEKKHSALYNFSNLVRYAKIKGQYDYYMFSDQDDVWLEHKIEKSLSFIENQHNTIPTLIYTSKQYVDEELNNINWNIKHEEVINQSLLIQNKTYGCTYLFNNALFNKLDNDISSSFVNYDHYVAIQALLYGEIYFLPEKTILYRQHINNVSGVIKKPIWKRINVFSKYTKVLNTFYYLLSYCNGKAKDLKYRKIFDDLFISTNRIVFIVKCLKYRMYLNSFLGNFQFYLTCLFKSRKDYE